MMKLVELLTLMGKQKFICGNKRNKAGKVFKNSNLEANFLCGAAFFISEALLLWGLFTEYEVKTANKEVIRFHFHKVSYSQ